MIRKLLLLLLLFSLAGVWAVQELERRWQEPLVLPADGLPLIVESGESLRGVARRLHEDGVLPYPDLLIAYGRWTGIDQQIKRGEYLLSNRMTPLMLLDLLRSGKVIEYQVTLPEGITVRRAVEILASQPHLESVLEGPEDARISAIIEPYTHPEGLFFPDTYQYARNATDLELLQRAHKKMVEVLALEWQGRSPDLPYENPYEALVMASIIERETGLPQERGEIAGVFVRRLQKGMRLQTDPTVIYGLGLEFDGNLRRSHLTDDSNIYNTYRIAALPPTPIALPGQAAIHAALHPTEGDALFFVARGDGGHEFNATLAGHEKAVRKFQLRRKKDYRSSPEVRQK